MLDWMFDFFSEDEIVVDEVTGEKMTRVERRKLKRDRKHEDKLKKAQENTEIKKEKKSFTVWFWQQKGEHKPTRLKDLVKWLAILSGGVAAVLALWKFG